MVRRNACINRLVRSMWNRSVKILTGMRGCGKSVLLFDLFYDELLARGVPQDHILKIELDKPAFRRLQNPVALCEYVEGVVCTRKDEKFYLLIDEVQLTNKIPAEETGCTDVTLYDMLNELNACKNLEVYAAGSNARGLSKDVATEFRGRSQQIPVFPLSFAEVYEARGGNEQKALQDYMQYGGLPGLLAYEDEQDKKDYLASLCSGFVQDIAEGCGESRDSLNGMLKHLARHASPATPACLAEAISMKGRGAPARAAKLVQACTDAFILAEVGRYDVGRRTFSPDHAKYCFTDAGLKNALLDFQSPDPGSSLEDIVCMELLRRGCCLASGVIDDRDDGTKMLETGFVVSDADKKCYIQTAWRLDTESGEPAKVAALKRPGDFFKKIVVRMDVPYSFYDDTGIFHCSLADLLLGRAFLF